MRWCHNKNLKCVALTLGLGIVGGLETTVSKSRKGSEETATEGGRKEGTSRAVANERNAFAVMCPIERASRKSKGTYG